MDTETRAARALVDSALSALVRLDIRGDYARGVRDGLQASLDILTLTAKHEVEVRVGRRDEGNFVYECACGHRGHVATTNVEFARAAADRHVQEMTDQVRLATALDEITTARTGAGRS